MFIINSSSHGTVYTVGRYDIGFDYHILVILGYVNGLPWGLYYLKDYNTAVMYSYDGISSSNGSIHSIYKFYDDYFECTMQYTSCQWYAY